MPLVGAARHNITQRRNKKNNQKKSFYKLGHRHSQSTSNIAYSYHDSQKTQNYNSTQKKLSKMPIRRATKKDTRGKTSKSLNQTQEQRRVAIVNQKKNAHNPAQYLGKGSVEPIGRRKVVGTGAVTGLPASNEDNELEPGK